MKRKVPSSLGGKKWVFLLDGGIPFHLFEGQIRLASVIGSMSMKLIYSIKCDAMSICACILSQEDLTVMLYLYDLYKANRICVYVEKEPHQTLSLAKSK